MNTSYDFSIPVLASLNIEKTVEFYSSILGFAIIYQQQDSYGIVQRDHVEIHFWACPDKYIAQNTACRIKISNIDSLYQEYLFKAIIHPNLPLSEKPWGTKEFAILDLDGNQITFFE